MTAEELDGGQGDARAARSCRCRRSSFAAPSPSPRGHAIDLRATMRRMTGAAGAVAPLAAPRAAPAAAAARRPLRHFRVDGSLRADAAAFPARDHQRPPSRARADVRNAAHQHHATPEASRCRRRAGRRDGGGRRLVGRHAHRLRRSRTFNRRWSRRLLGQNAVVLLISDGLDADAGSGARVRDGTPGEILLATRLAQSAAALRGISRRDPRASGRCCRTSTISCRCTTCSR